MRGVSLDDIRRARGIVDTRELDAALFDAEQELPLAALRKAGEVTQVEMAKRLDKTQAAISKFEGRGDFLCSTLYRYANALDAHIDLSIDVGGKRFRLVPREDEGDIYFVLSNSMSKASSFCSYGENILEFKAKQKKRPSSVTGAWTHRVPTESMNGVIDALLDISNEEKSVIAKFA